MAYPRTPDLHAGWSLAGRSNVSFGDARVKYETEPGYVPSEPRAPSVAEIEGTTYEGHASSSTRSYDSWLRVIGALYTLEGNAAYGFSDAIAVGGWFSTEMLGAELRAQPFSQRSGDVCSVSLSAGASHVGLLPSFERRLLRQGFGGRAGVDLGVLLGRDELLAGAYASYIRRRRNFQSIPDDGEFHEDWPGFVDGLMVLRDELKLSVPIGFALRAEHSAVVIGLVPEWTLHASVVDSSCERCEPYRLDRFEQEFAIYLTIGAEVWPRRAVAPPR
jgi:hypothetical protein